MLLFQCAYCSSEIEEDSFFCDQCGKEILLCETCRQPGRNQWCEEDGGALVSAKSLAVSAAGEIINTTVVNIGPVQQPASSINNTVAPSVTTGLKLTNGTLGISLTIQPDSILGRTTGPYANSLGSLSSISGKHLQFSYNPLSGWSFVDVGSSNGTKYNKTNVAWQQTPKLMPNQQVMLENKTYILVANIEFLVEIEGASSTTTQRI